ncbi:UDP-glucose 4-epimerase GalE [Sansalvadorimonas verongulae]|uniref:UDP-glucose 4-epimerase GalE n=1 Tax=Sansalvadorimonas verongulae TaxID=2172824 RepID=UPI002E33BA82|nr:UDP-glucose 4-epimerase GalE [Sansalvadorimonas verongulae]
MSNADTILVTGGLGYIGSHVVLELMEEGHSVVVFDNGSNASRDVIDSVSRLAAGKGRVDLFEGDITEPAQMDKVFQEYSAISTVIHCAGLKSVAESEREPDLYRAVNVTGTSHLLSAMERAGVKHFIFSSSATVYGNSAILPMLETAPLSPQSQYGKNKVEIEKNLHAWQKKNGGIVVVLRYFNPIGAHKSGLLGDRPKKEAANLLPAILETVSGKRPELTIYGGYNTPDGTGIRDYIHVVDLARGHLQALKYEPDNDGVYIFNLGLGKGYSTQQVVDAFIQETGLTIKQRRGQRREGDVDACYADNTRALQQLNWKPEYQLNDMLSHAWLSHKSSLM